MCNVLNAKLKDLTEHVEGLEKQVKQNAEDEKKVVVASVGKPLLGPRKEYIKAVTLKMVMHTKAQSCRQSLKKKKRKN